MIVVNEALLRKKYKTLFVKEKNENFRDNLLKPTFSLRKHIILLHDPTCLFKKILMVVWRK